MLPAEIKWLHFSWATLYRMAFTLYSHINFPHLKGRCPTLPIPNNSSRSKKRPLIHPAGPSST